MENINDTIEKSYLAQVLNSAALTGNTDEVEKAFSNIIEKGKKANIGEIREWAGGKFRKTQSGWEPVKNSGSVKEVESKKIVDDVNHGKKINELYNEFDKIKDQKDWDKWAKNLQDFKVGTYENKNILDILDNFNPKFPNNFIKNSFISEVKQALEKRIVNLDSLNLDSIHKEMNNIIDSNGYINSDIANTQLKKLALRVAAPGTTNMKISELSKDQKEIYKKVQELYEVSSLSLERWNYGIGGPKYRTQITKK